MPLVPFEVHWAILPDLQIYSRRRWMDLPQVLCRVCKQHVGIWESPRCLRLDNWIVSLKAPFLPVRILRLRKPEAWNKPSLSHFRRFASKFYKRKENGLTFSLLAVLYAVWCWGRAETCCPLLQGFCCDRKKNVWTCSLPKFLSFICKGSSSVILWFFFFRGD